MNTEVAKVYQIGKSGQKLVGIRKRCEIKPGDDVLIIKLNDIIKESELIKEKLIEYDN